MSNDPAVVCQAISVITLHILRWAQAVQSIWTKDLPYGTCGAHTSDVMTSSIPKKTSFSTMTLPRTEVTTIREKAEVQATSKLLHSLKKIKLSIFIN